MNRVGLISSGEIPKANVPICLDDLEHKKFHLTLPSIVVAAAALSRQNRIDVRSCHTNHAQIGTAAASKPPTFKCFRCLACRCQPPSTKHSRLSLHYSISVVIFVGKCLLIKNSLDSSKRDILKSSEMSHSM